MKVLKYIAAAVLGAIVLGAAGCIRDDIGKTGPDGLATGRTRVEFTLDFPHEIPAATRAEGEEEVFNEDEIHDLNVLVFHINPETNLLACVDRIEVPITNLDQSGDYKAFAIDYTPDEPAGLYGFMVFANLDSALDALPKEYYNDYKEDPRYFYSYITFGIPDGGLEYLPMWGIQDTATTITSTTKIPTIQMLRAVARIDLEVSSNLADQLRFKEAGGVIVPYSYATNYSMNMDYTTTSRKVNSPTYSESEELRATPLTFPATDNSNTVTFYIGEYSKSADNEFCMLINAGYGVAGLDVPYWYKVLVRDKQGNKIDILRNHRYVITITGVTGPGADTPDEALDGPSYIQATVTPWNDAEQNVVFDGMNMLMVSESEFTIYQEAGNTVITAYTNYVAPEGSDFSDGISWTFDGAGQPTDKFNVTQKSKTSTMLELTVTWAALAETYRPTITFTAGNMSYTVKITHSSARWMTWSAYYTFYLLDGKFNELGVNCNDEWSVTAAYEQAPQESGDISDYFHLETSTSDEIQDKVLFSTDKRPHVYDDYGRIRLTFHNESRNYTQDKWISLTLTSGTMVDAANSYIMQAGAHEALIFPLRSYDDNLSGSKYPTYIWTDDATQTEAVTGGSGVVASMRILGSTTASYVRVRGGDGVGNTVIGIKSSETDKIIWSYHIWSVEDKATLEAGLSGAGGLKWMDRDLGARANYPVAGDNGPTFGLFYQSGRKDPFPFSGFDATHSYDYRVFDSSLEEFGNANTGFTSADLSGDNVINGDGTVFTIENPTKWIDHKNAFHFSHSWNDGTATGKTKYDPCPLGWRVANSNLYKYSSSEDGSFTNGTWGLSTLIANSSGIGGGVTADNHGGYYSLRENLQANYGEKTLWAVAIAPEDGSYYNDFVALGSGSGYTEFYVQSGLITVDSALGNVRCVKD
jgi:hypothetical protein